MHLTRRTHDARYGRPTDGPAIGAQAPRFSMRRAQAPGLPTFGTRAIRWTATATLATSAAMVLGHESGYRGVEAWAAGHATAFVTATPAYVYRNTFFVDVGTPDIFGLRVTDECTSAVIVAGLLGLTALLALITRVPLRRLALAALLSGGAFYLLNLIRLISIALATRQWGLGPGFYWSHIWAGGFLTIVGAAGILALYLATVGRVRRRSRAAGVAA